MPTMTRCALAPVLASFMQANPNVRRARGRGLQRHADPADPAGELDFAVVPAFCRRAGTEQPAVPAHARGAGLERRSQLTHLAPVRLASLGPLKLVVPGKLNTRRTTIETYCASNGVHIERLVELDAMLATLDLVARSDWVDHPAGAHDGDRDRARRLFMVNPLVSPALRLDLVLIEPSRRPMAPGAHAFLQMLEDESHRINRRWEKLIG